MSRQTLEALRIPAAILLVLVVVFVLWPRDDPRARDADPTPSPSVVLGEVGGALVSPSAAPSAAPSATPLATSSPAATPDATSTAPPAPAADGFGAEVLACRSISGSRCERQLGTLPASASAFTALVRFTSANAGDELNAILSGPGGTLPGFPYVLQGSGDGYYYTQFQSAGLPGGTYTLTATRNGQDVAATSFRIAGN